MLGSPGLREPHTPEDIDHDVDVVRERQQKFLQIYLQSLLRKSDYQMVQPAESVSSGGRRAGVITRYQMPILVADKAAGSGMIIPSNHMYEGGAT